MLLQLVSRQSLSLGGRPAVEREGQASSQNPILVHTSSFLLDIDSSGMDAGMIGAKFTWSNGHSIGDLSQKRLDRALCNSLWRHMFPEAFVKAFVHSKTMLA